MTHSPFWAGVFLESFCNHSSSEIAGDLDAELANRLSSLLTSVPNCALIHYSSLPRGGIAQLSKQDRGWSS